MASNNASTGDIKSSTNEMSTEPKNGFQDTKQADAEQSYPEANPGELKRKLKSRHLQMIAIGMSLVSPRTSSTNHMQVEQSEQVHSHSELDK
jgi:amino acid transporter